MNSMVSEEEENFLRIVYLNYRVATGALTNFFYKLHPNLSADLHIPGNKALLQRLYNPLPGKKRVLYPGQWNILYPPTGAPAVTLADLDLTLIVCLLRNLPPLVVAPVNGFDELPHPNDISDGANIARLKYYKNFLVSHSEDGKLSNVDFVSIWNTLEQAIKGLDNSIATAVTLKEAKKKKLDNSLAELLPIQIQLSRQVSSLRDELEQLTENVEERMKITEINVVKDRKESNANMEMLFERLNTKEVHMVERVETIEKELNEYQNWQNLLASKFIFLETTVKESKEEKDKFEKDVKSFCRQIQYYVGKHKKRIEALEKKSESFVDTLHEVQVDVDSIKSTAEGIEEELRRQDEDHIPKNIRGLC